TVPRSHLGRQSAAGIPGDRDRLSARPGIIRSPWMNGRGAGQEGGAAYLGGGAAGPRGEGVAQGSPTIAPETRRRAEAGDRPTSAPCAPGAAYITRRRSRGPRRDRP